MNEISRILSNKVVQEFFLDNFGENSIKVVKVMDRDMSDEEIAAKSKVKITEVRAILNKLSYVRLIEYSKFRDENTGWYSYTWRLNLSRLKEVMEKVTLEKIRELESKANNVEVFSFYCPKCSRENVMDYDLASTVNFRCPNCDGELKFEKNDTVTIIGMIEELKKKYEEIKKFELPIVQKESNKSENRKDERDKEVKKTKGGAKKVKKKGKEKKKEKRKK